MSYRTWCDSLPNHLKTEQEKLEIIRTKMLPEPMVVWPGIHKWYGDKIMSAAMITGVTITYTSE